jgi:hypothetical protein
LPGSFSEQVVSRSRVAAALFRSFIKVLHDCDARSE